MNLRLCKYNEMGFIFFLYLQKCEILHRFVVSMPESGYTTKDIIQIKDIMQIHN